MQPPQELCDPVDVFIPSETWFPVDSTKAGRVSFFIAESMVSRHRAHTQQIPVLRI